MTIPDCHYCGVAALEAERDRLKAELTPVQAATVCAFLKEECEQQHARAEQAEAERDRIREALTWQPIETHDRSRDPVLVALIRDGKVWRADIASFNGLGYYSAVGGVACHWRTHWMPLPAPPTKGPQP